MSDKHRIVQFVSESRPNYGVVEDGDVVKDDLPDPKAARAWLNQYTAWSPQ